MNRITPGLIKQGIKQGLVRFIKDPNAESGTVCAIGEHWFYFGGQTAEELAPETYLEAVGIHDTIQEIVETLDDFKAAGGSMADEYAYYDHFLRENLNLASPNRRNRKKQKITLINARRFCGFDVTERASIRIIHDKKLDVLDAIQKCFSDWFANTKRGKAAWADTNGDYNIGDYLCMDRPDSQFTSRYGFEILPDCGMDIIDIDYDWIWGSVETPDEEV